jgi:hypothetical protein
MTPRSRLIPLLVAVLVVQGLVGVVPHTHGIGGHETEVPQADRFLAPHGFSEVTHDCLACSVHAPAVDSATDRGLIHRDETTAPSTVDRRSVSALSVNRTDNPRAPPWIV